MKKGVFVYPWQLLPWVLAPAVIPCVCVCVCMFVEMGWWQAPADQGLSLYVALVGLALLVGYAVGAYRIQLFKYGAMEVYNAAAMTVPSGELPHLSSLC